MTLSQEMLLAYIALGIMEACAILSSIFSRA